MLDAGAQPIGDPRECHAIAVDARAPKFDGGIVTRLDCIPLGIVVNSHGERFYDEGEDFWPKRYAIWGKLVARQPEQIAYSIVDAKAAGTFMPSVFPPIVGELDRRAGASARPAARRARGDRRRPSTAPCAPARSTTSALDDCRTEGLSPEQDALGAAARHAAVLGVSAPARDHVHVSRSQGGRARARADADGQPAANVYAAGEVMAGNILRQGLPRRRRHDDRHRVRPHCRRGGGTACRPMT